MIQGRATGRLSGAARLNRAKPRRFRLCRRWAALRRARLNRKAKRPG
jgi:hypothetical protein